MDEFTISRSLESPGLNEGLGRSGNGKKRRRGRRPLDDPPPEDTVRDGEPGDGREGRRPLDILA